MINLQIWMSEMLMFLLGIAGQNCEYVINYFHNITHVQKIQQFKRNFRFRFYHFRVKQYIVGMHWNCLVETIPMHTNNICVSPEVIELESK